MLETLKKVFVLLFAALAVSIVYVAKLPAQGNGCCGVISTIADALTNPTTSNTSAIGVIMNDSNQILNLLNQQAGNSTQDGASDDGSGTPPLNYSFINSNYQYFVQLANDFASSQNIQDGFQQQTFADLLGYQAAALNTPVGNPVLGQIPNANEMAFGTLLGKPPVKGGAYTLENNLINLAVMNSQRPVPNPKVWQGTADAIAKYQTYYTSVTSLQSLNAYVLTQLFADIQADNNSPGIESLQQTLTQQATNQTFISVLNLEPMGRVFRQMLLFTAGNYVLNTQIQRSLRQLVAAQAAQNSLMILFNMTNENQLIRNAKGLQTGQ